MYLPALSSRLARVFLAAMLCAGASPALAGSFDVRDDYGSGEISESERFYVDEQLVATFHLDADHTSQTVHVDTAMGRLNHSYALCGEIYIRRPSGKVEIHQVSGEGVLYHPDGHHYEAIASRNFTEFYLVDDTEPESVERHPGHSSLCAAPTS